MSRLKPLTVQADTAWKASLPAVLGKTAVRNDRGDRGNVGIIRSPIRASILPDYVWVKSVDFAGPPHVRFPSDSDRSGLRAHVH